MSVAMRFGLPFLGQLMTGLVLVGVFYYQRRYRPNLHDSTTIAILAVLLLGPVSWAGYTLFLLPFLFSRPWNRNIWIGVLILSLPFWLIREATVGGAISNALLGSAYAWAVLLLMATVLLEGMPEEDKEDLRDRLWRARRTLMVILGREPEDEPQPVAVATSATPRVRR
jgi:hypothetical protein